MVCLVYAYLSCHSIILCIRLAKEILEKNLSESNKFKIQMYLVEAYLINMDLK